MAARLWQRSSRTGAHTRAAALRGSDALCTDAATREDQRVCALSGRVLVAADKPDVLTHTASGRRFLVSVEALQEWADGRSEPWSSFAPEGTDATPVTGYSICRGDGVVKCTAVQSTRTRAQGNKQRILSFPQ